MREKRREKRGMFLKFHYDIRITYITDRVRTTTRSFSTECTANEPGICLITICVCVCVLLMIRT
jgi:hypothetical protein